MLAPPPSDHLEQFDSLSSAKITRTEQVERLLDLLTVDFYIRGTSKRYTSDEALSAKERVPAYKVNPEYALSPKAWLKRLHATLAAATSRALEHCIGLPYTTGAGKFSEKLPVILALGPHDPNIKHYGPVESCIDSRFIIGFNPRDRSQFRPHREKYERAILHGREVGTFMEIDLHTHEQRGLDHAILFSVELLPKEHDKIVSELDQQCAELGLTSLMAYHNLCKQRYLHIETEQLFEEASRLFKVNLSPKHFEATMMLCEPAGQLYARSVTQLLVKKFVQKGLSFAREYLTELDRRAEIYTSLRPN